MSFDLTGRVFYTAHDGYGPFTLDELRKFEASFAKWQMTDDDDETVDDDE